jgi:PAS domain S-box-containing protein
MPNARPHPLLRRLAAAAGAGAAWAWAGTAAAAAHPAGAEASGGFWPLAAGLALGLAGLAAGRGKAPPGRAGAEEHAERQRLEEVLRASRNKLGAIFDSIADPILSLTPAGKVESVNRAAASRAGQHPRELVGLGLVELLERTGAPPLLRKVCAAAFAELMERRAPRYRLVEVHGPEGPEHYEISLIPALNRDGGVNVAILQFKDITIFKRMEATIREYSHSLEEKVAQRTAELTAARDELAAERDRLARMNRELKRLEELRSNLTSMVVHDLKGPLAEIMGNLEMLSFGSLDEAQSEALDLATMAADELLRMIMNLLDIDRMEEGVVAPRRGRLRFAELAGAVAERFRAVVRLKELELAVSDGTEAPFPADPELLARVLQNLVTNAVAHTAEGGRVELAGREEGGGVVLSVSDNGEGIPAGQLERIFQKFTQAGGGGDRTSTGLGLAFCKLAVEAHGGRIWVESAEGAGSTFSLWLPRPAAGGERPGE